MIRIPGPGAGGGVPFGELRGKGPAVRRALWWTRRLVFGLGLIGLVGLAACGRITMDLAGGGRSVYVPVDRLPSGVDFQYVPSPQDSHFEIRARAHWILWAIPVNHPDWESLLAKELKDSEGIGNLVITTRARFGDVLVGLLTLGCYRTTQVILTGDRVQLTLVAPLALPETDKPELSPVE